MKQTVSVAILALLAGGCSVLPTEPTAPLQANLSSHATTTTTRFSTPFQATAQCGSSIGRIQFSGIIEGVDHTTVDGRGETHRTRQFRVKGLDGVNLDYGTLYKVQGGAEMLTWHTQIGQVPGNPSRSMHAGTLVFTPLDGGPRVVAHHAIRYVENGQGELVVNFSEWRCTRGGAS